MSDDLRDESRALFKQAWDDAGEFLEQQGLVNYPEVQATIATAFADIQLTMLGERNGVQTAGRVIAEAARRGLRLGLPHTGQ